MFEWVLERAKITTGDVTVHTLRQTALSRMIEHGPGRFVGGIVALLSLGSGSRTGPESGTRQFDSIRLSRLTSSGTAGSAAISRDARYAAYVSFADGKRSLVLRQIATTSNVELIPPDEARLYGPRFSPDGNHIYYVSSASGSLVETLYRIPILGGGASRVLEDIATPVEFSPDGQQFAFLRHDPNTGTTAIILSGVDGSSQRTLAARNQPQTYQLYSVSWSPDGKSIAATATSEEDRPQIVVLDIASGKETVSLTPDWRGVGRVSWLPDGASLIATAYEGAGEASDQVFLVSHPSGATRRLTSDLSRYSGLSVHQSWIPRREFAPASSEFGKERWARLRPAGYQQPEATSDALELDELNVALLNLETGGAQVVLDQADLNVVVRFLLFTWQARLLSCMGSTISRRPPGLSDSRMRTSIA